jgi:hypothetical protein
MNELTCHEISCLLVDYADGELASEKVELVHVHVERCPACAARVRELDTSLQLAREIWAGRCSEVDVPPSLRPRRDTASPIPNAKSLNSRRFLIGPAVAALVLVSVLWMFRQTANDGAGTLEVAKQPSWIEHSKVATPAADRASDLLEMERRIAREAMAARLAKSAEVLAAEPGGEAYALASLRYLAENFGNTTAGLEVRQLLETREN